MIADGVSGRTTGALAAGTSDGAATEPTPGDKIIVTADRVHTPNLITDGVDFSDIDAEWADLQHQGNMLLLEATGGDVGAARQMLKESFALTYDQARASATPAPGATAAHYDYTAPTGSPGSYDDVMPVTDRPDFLQPGGGLTIGNVVDVGGGKADWVVNTEKTASMNAALAGFDNDMIEMSTLGPRYGAELATGDFAIGLLAKGINVWRAGRVIEAADAEVLTGVRANQLAGSGREALARAELEAQYPGASIQNEVYLRSANGGRAIDPLTGEARRIDSVVIQDGQVLDSVEVTSMNANKAAQIAKEMRIRQSGGAFVRDRGTGNLIDISQVLTRIVRKPWVATSYTIDQISWHTGTPGNTESREQIVRRFCVVANFLQSNGLTTRDLSCQEAEIGDSFGISSDDLTGDGMAVMKAAYDRWLTKVDNGMPPEDVTLLQKALKKVRGG